MQQLETTEVEADVLRDWLEADYHAILENPSLLRLSPSLSLAEEMPKGITCHELFRAILSDALFQEERASDKYVIHEQKRDYFCAYHQVSLLILGSRNSRAAKEVCRIASCLAIIRNLCISIIHNRIPDLFSLPGQKNALEADSFKQLEAYIALSLLLSDKDRRHGNHQWTEFEKRCYDRLPKYMEEAFQTGDTAVLYLLNACERIRHLREDHHAYGQAFESSRELHKLVGENHHKLKHYKHQPLLYGYLNQAGKSILAYSEQLRNARLRSESIQDDPLLLMERVRHFVDSCSSVRAKAITEHDDDILRKYAIDILVLSAGKGSCESINLLAMIEEKAKRYQHAFLHYSIAAVTIHPRTQTYAQFKQAEMIIRKNISYKANAQSLMPKSYDEYLKCNPSNLLCDMATPDERRVSLDRAYRTLVYLDACDYRGDLDYLYALYYIQINEYAMAWNYLKQFVDRNPKRLDALVDLIWLSEQSFGFDIGNSIPDNMAIRVTTDALVKSYENRACCASDKWAPDTDYLQSILNRYNMLKNKQNRKALTYMAEAFEGCIADRSLDMKESIHARNLPK